MIAYQKDPHLFLWIGLKQFKLQSMAKSMRLHLYLFVTGPEEECLTWEKDYGEGSLSKHQKVKKSSTLVILDIVIFSSNLERFLEVLIFVSYQSEHINLVNCLKLNILIQKMQ